MQAAHDLMRSFPDCNFALLFSSAMAVPFYKSLGWQVVAGTVTCEQPDGRIDYTASLPPEAPVMALALREDAALPSASIHVCGLPWWVQGLARETHNGPRLSIISPASGVILDWHRNST
jgi:hypothetical protein